MKFILDILKGMVIGIANIIPGVSGGTMMVAMGIYDKLLHSLTHLFKEFKKSVITLLPIFIGMGLGILGLARLIEWMFGVIPIQTNLLFIGLILGGIPVVWNRVKGASIRPWHILGFIIFFALVVVLAYFDGTEGVDADMTFGVWTCIKLLAIGVVAAATMVIPGVSGSMMLMLLGYYQPIIATINALIDALTGGDWNAVFAACGVLIPFGIGVVVGIFLVAKLIEVLITKFPYTVFWCILGLIVASPVAIVMLNDFSGINVISIITGIIAFAIGFVIAMFLGGDKLAKGKENANAESKDVADKKTNNKEN